MNVIAYRIYAQLSITCKGCCDPMDILGIFIMINNYPLSVVSSDFGLITTVLNESTDCISLWNGLETS